MVPKRWSVASKPRSIGSVESTGSNEAVMNLDEAETRLSQERAWLIRAEHSGVGSAIALAQAHVNYWQSEVFRLRLQETGGWNQ